MRVTGHAGKSGEVYTGLWWGVPEVKRPPARPRLRWGTVLHERQYMYNVTLTL